MNRFDDVLDTLLLILAFLVIVGILILWKRYGI